MKILKMPVALLTLASAAVAVPAAEAGMSDPEPTLSVLRKERAAYVRWPFDAERDIVANIFVPANEGTHFVPKTAPADKPLQGARWFHGGGDDFPATSFGGYGYLSGNHGSCYGHVQTVPGHGFTEGDIGREVRHSSGETFRLVDVPDKDTVILHPDGHPGADPKFVYLEKGTFTCGGKSWTDPKTRRDQLHPTSYYLVHRWVLPDGSVLPEGVATNVPYVDLEISHRVVDPRAVMRHLKEHPGKRLSFNFGSGGRRLFIDTPEAEKAHADYLSLATLMSVRATYRFLPHGARVLTREATYDTALSGVDEMGVMYAWNGKMPAWTNLVFYAPRCKAKQMDQMQNLGRVTVDLTAAAPFDTDWQLNGHVERTDCTDPENPPDRFIRIGGPAGRRLGVALGYSLVDGVTSLANRGRDRPQPYYFWRGGKMYPQSYALKDVRPGRKVRSVAYVQYFNPQDEPDATAFYHHREGDATIVHFDTHRTLKGKKLRLPPELAGRPFEILEKTPSVTLHADGRVPADGALALDVADGYGTLVLKVGPPAVSHEVVRRAMPPEQTDLLEAAPSK